MLVGLVAILGLVAVVLVSAFSRRLGIAAPLLLLVVGIGYGLIPGLPAIRVPPDVILMGVLPPLLYSAAVNVPLVDFRRNLRSITALSVGLVVVNALVTGFVLFALLPDLNLGYAIAVGAVIGPTDVVAATSVAQRLGLPSRLVTILEGEGLVNDATALVLLRSAVAAGALSTAGDFTVASSVGSFLYAVLAAAAIGVLVGWLSVRVRARLNDPVLDTVLSLAVPFVAYLPAEEIGASGVIAVVAAGLYSGHAGVRRFSAAARITQRTNWRVIQFVLENGVFLLMGSELVTIVREADGQKLPLGEAVLLGLLCVALLIVLRVLFVAPLLLLLRRVRDRAERRHERFDDLVQRLRGVVNPDERFERRRERLERVVDRRANDLAQLRAEGLGVRGGLVLGWAGMRGVVTLAAAQSLPTDTPYRDQLVLIAFTVAAVTLLLQGGTLPFVIRLSGVRGADAAADRRELADLLDELSRAGLETLDAAPVRLPGGQEVPDDVVERVRHETLTGVRAAQERAEREEGEEAGSPEEQYRQLRSAVIDAERSALLDARSRGAYPSRILRRAQSLIDFEDERLRRLGGPAEG